MSIFIEISLLLALTTLVTVCVKILKQPLVVGYILSGILVGPQVLGIVQSHDELEFFSKVGIVFLLFIVGLHLNPKVIKEVGSVSLITGIGQILFTSVIGFGLALFLGIDRLAALYIAIALTFSSTIIILKLLADKNELQSLYAKIAIGFLLVQDIVATFVLIGVTVFTGGNDASLGQTIILILCKGIGLLGALYLLTRYVIPKLTQYVAHSQELLFLFSLSWGTGLASLFMALGFSIEVGALIAGVTLSVTSYAEEISARLKPIRDFFIIIFFILLGSQMVLTDLGGIVIPALILSIFVLIGNPIIVIILMNLVGYNKRTGFMAGLTVAQISEFSLILATLGMRVGHISQQVLSLITLVGLITIAGSTYLILYSEKIYPKIKHLLRFLELIKSKKRQKGSVGENYAAVIFGFDRVGHTFVEALDKTGQDFLVVDYDPQSIALLQSLDIPHQFGDASDIELLEELPVKRPRLVISTIPNVEINTLILTVMKHKNSTVIFIPIAHNQLDAQKLYQLGATYVIIPHHLGAELAAKLIKKHGLHSQAYKAEKEKQLATLEKFAQKRLKIITHK